MTSELSKEDIRALKLHKRAVYVDAHCDSIMAWMPPVRLPSVMRRRSNIQQRRSLAKQSKVGHIELPRMLEGNVDCQIFAVYIPPIFHPVCLKQALQMIDIFYSEIRKNSNKIAFCTSFSDILRTQKDEKIAALLSIEGGEPLKGTLGY